MKMNTKKYFEKSDLAQRPSSILSDASRYRLSLRQREDKSRVQGESDKKESCRSDDEEDQIFVGYGNAVNKKANRANSLPGSRMAFLARPRPPRKRPPSSADNMECRSGESELFSDDMSLDQMSDYADSEEDSREARKELRTKQDRQRQNTRRGSGTDILRTSAVTVEEDCACACGRSPRTAKLSSGRPFRSFSRRSSLQSFTYKGTSFGSTESAALPRDGPARRYERRNSVSSFVRKPPPGIFGNSPDFTSEASTCENSPSPVRVCKEEATETLDSDAFRKESPERSRGEWDSFWNDYNRSDVGGGYANKFFYDDCPTPFNRGAEDFERNAAEGKTELRPPDSEKRAKEWDGDTNKNNTDLRKEIEPKFQENDEDSERNAGVYLSKNETKEIIECARRLAEILTSALERDSTKKVGGEAAEAVCRVKRNSSEGLREIAEEGEASQEAVAPFTPQLKEARQRSQGRAACSTDVLL